MSAAQLSKSILQMKFMKKTKEKVEKQQFQEEGEEYFGSGLTESMKKDSDRFITTTSYAFCENLIDGRLSFQGMNPEIEKLMEEENAEKRAQLEAKKESDISDQQMAQHFKMYKRKRKSAYKYEADSDTKYNSKDDSTMKKPKFLKPVD